LSQDGEELVLTNRKPIEFLKSDLEREDDRREKEAKGIFKDQKSAIEYSDNSDTDDEDQYDLTRSSASC
jgi:hypothetical protein